MKYLLVAIATNTVAMYVLHQACTTIYLASTQPSNTCSITGDQKHTVSRQTPQSFLYLGSYGIQEVPFTRKSLQGSPSTSGFLLPEIIPTSGADKPLKSASDDD